MPAVVPSLPQELTQKLVVVVGEDELSKEAQVNSTVNFMTMLRSTLASKRILSEYRWGCCGCTANTAAVLYGLVGHGMIVCIVVGAAELSLVWAWCRGAPLARQ